MPESINFNDNRAEDEKKDEEESKNKKKTKVGSWLPGVVGASAASDHDKDVASRLFKTEEEEPDIADRIKDAFSGLFSREAESKDGEEVGEKADDTPEQATILYDGTTIEATGLETTNEETDAEEQPTSEEVPEQAPVVPMVEQEPGPDVEPDVPQDRPGFQFAMPQFESTDSEPTDASSAEMTTPAITEMTPETLPAEADAAPAELPPETAAEPYPNSPTMPIVDEQLRPEHQVPIKTASVENLVKNRGESKPATSERVEIHNNGGTLLAILYERHQAKKLKRQLKKQEKSIKTMQKAMSQQKRELDEIKRTESKESVPQKTLAGQYNPWATKETHQAAVRPEVQTTNASQGKPELARPTWSPASPESLMASIPRLEIKPDTPEYMFERRHEAKDPQLDWVQAGDTAAKNSAQTSASSSVPGQFRGAPGNQPLRVNRSYAKPAYRSATAMGFWAAVVIAALALLIYFFGVR